MRLNKDSFYGFAACAVLCATSFAIGANFQANPGREYFEACQAIQGEVAAGHVYTSIPDKSPERNDKTLLRALHWFSIMEKFEPNNPEAKKQLDLINAARKKANLK